ncbi:MAG: serine hydrolase [Ferruginibacter sp.]
MKKFYPNGEASVQSIIAGNDMLCLPEDVPLAINKIKAAIKKKKISWAEIELHCKKVLLAKYHYGLSNLQPINTINLTADLNSRVPEMRRTVAENAITLVSKKDSGFFPLRDTKPGDIAFIGIGLAGENAFAKRLIADHNATPFYFTGNEKHTDNLLGKLRKFRKIVIGIHGLSRFPANNFGLSKNNLDLFNALQEKNNSIGFLFANAYALKNMCNARNMVVCYEDDEVIQQTAADLLQGKLFYRGVLPVTVCENLRFGFGIETAAQKPVFEKDLGLGFYPEKLPAVDSLAALAVANRATPGGVVLVVKEGKVAYEKAFGNLMYDSSEPVTFSTVYDLASLTKIFSTTLGIMKLYEDGHLDLKKKLSDYLPETLGTNKQNITIEKLLLHEAGLEPFIPFYRETLDVYGNPRADIYSDKEDDNFNIAVASNLYLKNSWKDTVYKRLLMSKVTTAGKYVYSDNDYIFLAKIIEKITGQNIDEYVSETFYSPMQLQSLGYDPLQRNSISNIAPTENEKIFRRQTIRGFVHDPGAAIMGGVAGHAGLFGNAYDAAALMQMLLNGGVLGGRRYLQKATVDLFTGYKSGVSRRGYGFDKPEKENETRKEPYPSASTSPLSFGHTGFTGTAAWADPAQGLVYIFLSNRIYPAVNNTLLNMNTRGKIFDAIYAALIPANGSAGGN